VIVRKKGREIEKREKRDRARERERASDNESYLVAVETSGLEGDLWVTHERMTE
jgi:hypothetical protein